MRRLVIEAGVDELVEAFGESRIERTRFLKDVKLMETLAILKHEPREIAAIWRVKFADPSFGLDWIPTGQGDELQQLKREKDGSFLFFYRRNLGFSLSRRNLWEIGWFLSPPFEIRDGRARITFLGSVRAVGKLLRFLGKMNLTYRVVSLTDARFSPDSPLGRLTDMQRKVILTAFQLGYYDIPRRAGSREIAKEFGITNPALVMHRRKAERKILADLVTRSGHSQS